MTFCFLGRSRGPVLNLEFGSGFAKLTWCLNAPGQMGLYGRPMGEKATAGIWKCLIDDRDFFYRKLGGDFWTLLGHNHHLFEPYPPLEGLAVLRL